jgi:hypothetical protein
VKRLGHLFEQICTLENVQLADERARKHKSKNYGVIKHDLNKEIENQSLLESLKNLTYKTSEYSTFTIYEPKERLIFRLPYFPDRICHHTLMNILEPIWVKTFIHHTYSCIKGRGIHKLNKDLFKTLQKDVEGTKYCLKLDIRKFYPSIDHDVLKGIIRRKIKDKQLLFILDGIIDSADGVPIGNYLSQYFANLTLTYFDHWLKEEVKVKYYFRYADDIVVLSDSKDFLRSVLLAIKIFLKHNLKLKIKDNYQIFPVESRGIDFVGYKFFHTHILLRKSIKSKMKKLTNKHLDREELKTRLSSYFGWMKFCNSKHLLNLLESITGFHFSNWKGVEANISNFYGKNLNIIEVVPYSQYYKVHFKYRGTSYSVDSKSKSLYYETCNKRLYNFKLIRYANSSKNRNHLAS